MVRKKISTRQKRAEQHANRLAHEQIEHEQYKADKVLSIKLEDNKIPDDSVLDKFADTLNKKEPIIELFDIKNVKFKANITEEQRNIITILMSSYNEAVLIGQELGIEINMSAIRYVCAEFIEMSPSIDGKRAEQYVDAHKAQINQFMPPMGGQPGQGYGQMSDKMNAMRR